MSNEKIILTRREILKLLVYKISAKFLWVIKVVCGDHIVNGMGILKFLDYKTLRVSSTYFHGYLLHINIKRQNVIVNGKPIYGNTPLCEDCSVLWSPC